MPVTTRIVVKDEKGQELLWADPDGKVILPTYQVTRAQMVLLRLALDELLRRWAPMAEAGEEGPC